MRPVVEHDASSGGDEPEEGGERPPFSPVEIALFAVRAARQNLWFCLLITFVISVIGSTVVSALPPTYDVTSKIFVQEGGTLTTALASGRERYRPVDGKRGLQELLLARENLLSIVREAKLVDTWPRTRPLPMRIKDRIMEALVGPPARKDLERGFVEMLSTLITGEVDGDSAVRFHSKWRDRESAYDIARLVQRNFLAARAENDLGPIRRAIPFLEAQLAQANKAIESAVTGVQSAQTHSAKPAPAGKSDTPAPAPDPATSALVQELAALSKQLAETRREERTLVDPWRARITELKTQLVDLNASYSPEHPLVRQQQARIEAASVVPEDLARLREKEAAILSSLSSRGFSKAPSGVLGTDAQDRPQEPDAPELAAPRARLFAALRKSDEIIERLESARIELETAEADFQHRYLVVEPPELPNKPVNQKQPLFFAVVLIAAALIGFVAGAARELLRGRMVEPWQVRALGLELLAEVDLKKLPPGKS